MGLSAFNAMRAREKAEAEARAKSTAGVDVREVKPDSSEEKVEEKKYNFQKKRTDAEKLKKKE